MIHRHKPFYRGHEAHCTNCGDFLYDVRTGAKLAALTDVDPELVWVARQRFPKDPELAYRLANEDMREVVSTVKMSDKLHDFLMNPKSRPDLQTPEAQQFLKTLDMSYHNRKTDQLMPWLTREFKKGRVKGGEGSEPGVLRAEFGPDYAYYHPDGGQEESFHRLMPAELDHWADWANSNHDSRKAIPDLMSKDFTIPKMHQTIKDWDDDMRSKAEGQAQTRGNVVHSYPDGWSVQQLTRAKELEDEGEKMGHCVGSYAGQVQNGHSLIYSLRDQNNEPHATWEVTPRLWRDPKGETYTGYEGDGIPADAIPVPEEGQLEQIQGKGNEPPIPAYQKRIKDYFEHAMPKKSYRPQWDDQHYDNLDEFMDPEGYNGYIAYHPGDYGVNTPKTTYDWPNMLERHIGWSEYEPHEIVKKAVEHGQFPEMATEAEKAMAERKDNRRYQLVEEYERNGEEDNFAMHYHENDPEPQPEDEPYNEGDYDANGYNKAWEEWDKRQQEARDNHYEQYVTDRENEGWEEGQQMEQLEVELAAQKRKEAESDAPGVTASLDTIRTPHEHFTIGEPCHCTFRLPESFGWHQAVFMDEAPDTCPTCGDPLTHGKCKRCDWSAGPSNAMTDGEPIADPTKEVKPAIQS